MWPGDLLNVVFDAAFAAVLAGFVLFTVVVIALGVSMWRQASTGHNLDAHAAARREPNRQPGATRDGRGTATSNRIAGVDSATADEFAREAVANASTSPADNT
jgi:hypothetical protein